MLNISTGSHGCHIIHDFPNASMWCLDTDSDDEYLISSDNNEEEEEGWVQNNQAIYQMKKKQTASPI